MLNSDVLMSPFTIFIRSVGYYGSCGTCKKSIYAEKIPFSWIHSWNIQPFPCLMRFSQKLELSQEQRSACRFSSRALVFRLVLSHISNCIHTLHFFFFLKVQMALGALPFLWKVLCAWLLSLFIYFLSFAKLLLYSCKGICCISSVVHWLFGMEFDGQVSFTNPLVGLEPSV